nr:InlB B-repeat-containing protein [Lactimicrobium massiliense]
MYYSRKSYQETFNTGKGTYLSPRLIPYGKNVTLPNADDVVNTGYKLNAWKVEYGSVSVTLDPGSSFVMPAENVTVTAVWEESKTADVTIQIWQQRPFTKTKYTTSDYDYAGSYTVTDQKVGETYTTSDPAVRRNLGTQVSFDHFHYKGVIIGAGDAITDGAISLTVNADGNNVVNLYYDRDQITINFYYHDLIYYDYYTHTGYYTYPKTKPDYSWKGLYGEEFGDKYKWNTDYDWYSSRNPVQVRRKWYYEPSGSRLTFITYFHVEENYRDKNNKNTMNLYGFTASKGNSYIRHWVENLDGDGWTPKNDSESEYYTSFTFSNKYPYGFELDHYSHPEDWFGYIETGKAKENQTELVKNGLNIYYTRKNIQITLLNAVVNNDDSQVPYQFQEKYETGYDRIAKDLEKLSISKPDNVDGEEFVGWYLDPNYTKEFTGDVNSKLTQKLQLFAKWKKSQYHIYFYDEAGNQLGEKDVATGDQLYNSDTGVNDFPSVSAPDGHEVRWYYTDSNGKERQFIKDRKIMKDLLRSDDVGTDGYYTIHLKAKVMAAGEVNLTYQLVDQNGNKITYNGESTFTTAEKYTIGTEFNIVPPEIDGYTYMSGANGVAYDGTEKNPIKLYYNLSKGSWQYEKRLYAIYQDIDDSTKSEISVEIPTDNPVVSTEKEETVENSPRVDGYTFASSAVLKKGESSAERTTSSQLSLEKDNGSGQTAAFWYHPKWTGKLSDTTAVYDGSEHGVTFTPDHMPVIGDNTVVYKYTYTQTLAKTSESTVQYVWNDANGSHTSGKAPVNAGVYTVKVDVLLYNGTSLSENTLLNSSGSLLTVYSHEFDDGLNISPADVEITSANGSWAYDGQPHSLNSWSVSVNGTSVTQNESPVTVKFLQPYSTITEPGINVNRFTYEIKDGYLADNYKVTSNPGSLKVEWEYKVRYVLSLPDCVYEAKSDADKKKAEAAGKDVKPIQITMFENTDASPQPAPTFNDSSQEALDLEGLKRTDSGNQTIRYTDKDAVVTYTYTLDLDDVKLKKADDGSLQIVISDKDETKQKVLAALKPYLQAVKNTDSKDDDSETEKTPYETYQDTKNKDYRIVYRFTYTDAAKTDTAVTYLVNEDGTMVTDKPVSGNVPSAAGDYNVSGEILVQHRTETTDEEGNVTESWNDGNILWQSSTPENITIK